MTSLHRLARRRASLPRRALLSLGIITMIAACEVPTSAPGLDTRWIVPTQGATIAVAKLLPASISIVPDSSAFLVTVAPVTVTRALSQDCPACSAANGTRVPKPAFTATASAGSALPVDLASAMLSAGTLTLSLTNNYNFDPLRPSATERGYAVIAIANGSVQIGRDSVNGATTPLAPGATLVRAIPLAGTITGGSPVTVTVTIRSPAGDSVVMDASRTIIATATPSNVRVASAQIVVANRQISSSSAIDLSGVDASVQQRVDNGALLLTIVNPFNVTGPLTVSFAPAGGSLISRTVALGLGTTNPSIAFNQAELGQLLGHNVIVTFAGPLNATGGNVTVSPKQAVVVTSRLDLNLHVGSRP